MTVDALEFLRGHDPVPHGSAAPPMNHVLAHIEAAAEPGRRQGGRGRRPRFGEGALVPVLAVAATLAVIAVVVVLAVTHRTRTPEHLPPASRTAPTSQTVPSPESLMPRGGMPGRLSVSDAASPAADQALIFFGQCHPCRGDGSGRRQAEHLWQAATTDGGTTWHVAPSARSLTMLAFSGRDGWGEGVASNHGLYFHATHNGGRSWHLASSDAPAPGGAGDVSIAGGEVWSLGNGCTGATCTDTVLRAAASSDHLGATQAQPPLDGSTNVSIVAMSRDTAYVLADGVGSASGARMYATHDGGGTWQAGATPCRDSFGRLYRGGNALWALCTPMHGPMLVGRSTDGGGHWTTTSPRLGATLIQPASAQVAWAVSAGGRVLRTSDGGRTWSRVWYAGQAEPSVLAGTRPAGLNRGDGVLLTVQSPTTATVIAQVSRGHGGHPAQTDFVTYRTTDAGRTWRPSVVLLPAG